VIFFPAVGRKGGLNVGFSRKRRRGCPHRTILLTTANHLRFLAILVSGAYAPVVLTYAEYGSRVVTECGALPQAVVLR
jgi:hypothetical protein